MSNRNQNWQTICEVTDLVLDSGVCALVSDTHKQEQQIALFYVQEANEKKQVYALGNFDPIGKANVLYRGLIGCADEQIFVASPLYKQRYVLNDGRCLDDDTITLPVYDARINGSKIEVLL